jgi:ligand-binding sensor domain-containing protein
MKASCIISVLLLHILVVISASAQTEKIKFDHLSVKEGLSHGNVWDIHQDRLGFIWIGTEDGLNRYDGYTFTIFRNEQTDSLSISNNFIHCITEDASGNIWLGTQGGLNVYDRASSSFKRFTANKNIPHTISSDDVISLAFDAEINLTGAPKHFKTFIMWRMIHVRYQVILLKLYCWTVASDYGLLH